MKIHFGQYVYEQLELFEDVKKTNRGAQYEKEFHEHLKKHGIVSEESSSAGYTSGNDFVVYNKKKNKKHGGKLIGEIKTGDHSAHGQLTIHYDESKGVWYIPDDARIKQPRFAESIEKSGIIDRMNKEVSNPSNVERTKSGKAKDIVQKHDNIDPGIAYLQDGNNDILHSKRHGTFSVGDKDLSISSI
jgi:hypothetical protein